MSTIAERLGACPASAVHDVLREMGHGNCVLPPRIRALDPTRRLAGEVCTLSGRMDRTLSRDETLLRWSRVLSRAPRGKVLVCQPHTKELALMGELSARALMRKDVPGYVVDAHCRDADLIIELGFPVYCELTTPADIAERWTFESLGEPITIGNVTVSAGDYLVADRDGVVIVPRAAVSEAIDRTETVIATESNMRCAILDGMDPEQAYLKYRKF